VTDRESDIDQSRKIKRKEKNYTIAGKCIPRFFLGAVTLPFEPSISIPPAQATFFFSQELLMNVFSHVRVFKKLYLMNRKHFFFLDTTVF
jgi:hypothetical protein